MQSLAPTLINKPKPANQDLQTHQKLTYNILLLLFIFIFFILLKLHLCKMVALRDFEFDMCVPWECRPQQGYGEECHMLGSVDLPSGFIQLQACLLYVHLRQAIQDP